MENWNSTFKEHLILTAVDLTFFIIVTTIGLNIIFGIIVDTFSQLRDSKVNCDTSPPFLAHLTKGQVSFCQHLAFVVPPSYVVNFHI